MLLRNSQSTSGSEKEFNLQSIVETFYRASEMYKPGKYPGRLTLFRGSDARNSEQDDPTLGWGKWAGGGVELYDVPGTHLSMLEEPHAKVLAEHLTDCLNKQ